MTNADQLGRLIHAEYPCISVVTAEEHYALSLVRDYAIENRRDLWLWSIIRGVHDGLVSDSPTIAGTESPAAALYHLSQLNTPILAAVLDFSPHLRDEKVLRLLRDVIEVFRNTGKQLLLIDHRDELPAVIATAAARLELALPNEQELEDLMRSTLRMMNREEKIRVELTRRGLQTILRNLRGLNRQQAEQIIIDVVAEDRRFDDADINSILARKRQTLHSGGLLEYIETPATLDEIGGLSRLKKWLHQREDALSDEGVSFGLACPRGVLLLGVQGAGKSLCAKAIATAWRRPLLRLDPAGLYDRYVGESERRLRDALKQAEMMAPIVLWVDEIEKGFASAASHNTDGGLSQRMFGTLLTWMQEHAAPVFLVATANDIEALPPELLRKGRFDEIFFVDLPSAETRAQIFTIHLKKRQRAPEGFDLKALVAASEGYSGAEIEQAVVAALHNAFSGKKQLETVDIAAALRDSPPLSVTLAEKVTALRKWARGRCMPAD